ncbi:hypothetical protein [Massilimicrobiota sp. An80]|uniref:DUF6941 family protein n=1 Tax=Massilimicrobiota sp. An80 TaxID=1965658 RepID=UPI000B44FF09|nr:hypothetical protein [Massilimicrobiota sp. An80]OUN38302.1 hypothetical protein B5G32_01240 [Massilimicrobiota sp. An80]
MKEMKIQSFVYCEDIQNDPQGKTVIVGPLQMIITKYIPTDYSFNISFGIFNVPKDGFSINTEFYNPKGEKISENVLTAPQFPEEKINFPDLPLGVQINIGFRNISFEIQGEYKTVIKINGQECGTYPIEVYGAKSV